MLDKLLQKLTGNKADNTAPEATEFTPAQKAYAALLVEAARVDEAYTAVEAALITKLLIKQFELDDTNAKALRQEAEKAQEEATDLYRFSSVVKNEFSQEEKIELIEDLWEIILSDDDGDEFEEMIVRRLLGLIHVTDQESGAARKRVEARRSE